MENSDSAASVIQRKQRQRAAVAKVDEKKRLQVLCSAVQDQRIRVLAKYPDAPHDVVFYISGCTGLWDRDGGVSGKSDPYVKVYRRKDSAIARANETDDEEELVFESKRADNTLNPVWDRAEGTFRVALVPSRVQRDVRVEVWNWNSFTDDILGSFHYSLGDLFEAGSGVFTFPLKLHRTDDVEAFAYATGGGSFGHLTMNVDIRAPNSSSTSTASHKEEGVKAESGPALSGGPSSVELYEVRLYVAKCSGLMQRDQGNFTGVTDAFVSVLDPKDGSTRLRTPTVDNNVNPTWEVSESSLTMGLDPRSRSALKLQVWNWNATSDDFLGEVAIPQHTLFKQGSGALELPLCARKEETDDLVKAKAQQGAGSLGSLKLFITVPDGVVFPEPEPEMSKDQAAVRMQSLARGRLARNQVNAQRKSNPEPKRAEPKEETADPKEETAEPKEETAVAVVPATKQKQVEEVPAPKRRTDEDDLITLRISKKDPNTVQLFQSGVKTRKFTLRSTKSSKEEGQDKEEDGEKDTATEATESALPSLPLILKAALYEIEAFGAEQEDETPEDQEEDPQDDHEDRKTDPFAPHRKSSSYALANNPEHKDNCNHYAQAMLMLAALHKRTVELGEELIAGEAPSQSILKEKLSVVESGCYQLLRENRVGPAFGAKPSVLQMVYNSQNVEMDLVRRANDGTKKTTVERLPCSLPDIVSKCEASDKELEAAEDKYCAAMEGYEDAVIEGAKRDSKKQNGDEEVAEPKKALCLRTLRYEIRDSLAELHDKKLLAAQNHENKALVQFALEVLHSAEAKELPIANDKDRLQPLTMLRNIRANITVLEEQIREHQRSSVKKVTASSPARSKSLRSATPNSPSGSSIHGDGIVAPSPTQEQQDQRPASKTSAMSESRPPSRLTTTSGQHHAGPLKPSSLSTTLHLQQVHQQHEKTQFDRVGAYRELEALRGQEMVLEACLAEKRSILNLIHRDRLIFVDQVQDSKALLKEKDREVVRSAAKSTKLQHQINDLLEENRAIARSLKAEKARVQDLHANIDAVRDKRCTGKRTVTPYDIAADGDKMQPLDDERTQAMLTRLYDRELHRILHPKKVPNNLVTPVEPIEVEDFTKRMYYERRERIDKQQRKLHKKFLPELSRSPTTKEKVGETVERLAVTQIQQKNERKEAQFKEIVLSKEPVMAKRSKDEQETIIQRLYTKKE